MSTKIEAIVYDNVANIEARNELLVAIRRDAARIAELEAALKAVTDCFMETDRWGDSDMTPCYEESVSDYRRDKVLHNARALLAKAVQS